MGIIDFLRLPESKEIKDLDDPLVSRVHREIIQKNHFLRKLYIDFYKEFKNLVSRGANMTIVELGSGGGFIKEIMPNVITSDVDIPVPLDVKFSVDNIPFKDNSIDSFLLLNVFHHISRPLDCIREMERCLKTGGKIVMIEPANTFWRRLVDKNFHHEDFDVKAGWQVSGDGPLTTANGALPWIIFTRDRPLFEERFPGLRIKNIKLHNNFRYIASGGLTYRQLLPSFTYKAVRIIDGLFYPLISYFGYFQTIELEKNRLSSR